MRIVLLYILVIFPLVMHTASSVAKAAEKIEGLSQEEKTINIDSIDIDNTNNDNLTFNTSILPSPKPKIKDIDKIDDLSEETQKLPPYDKGNVFSVGKIQKYTIEEEDTLIDVSRHFELGYIELISANPSVDPWTPTPGQEITIPSFKLLPRATQKGIVVNLAQMRVYYFKNKKEIITYPIGIGRDGMNTPQGKTYLTAKKANPVWIPTERMREEKKWLPKVIRAGNHNPLGRHALYLGWPTFLIHGSNKPWAIGRRVSSGCMRMYPENVKTLFDMVPINIPVTIVSQPILVAEIDNKLYLEANPSKRQGNDIEITGTHEKIDLSNELKEVIKKAAGDKANTIDWKIVNQVVRERQGYPIVISKNTKTTSSSKPKAKHKSTFIYN